MSSPAPVVPAAADGRVAEWHALLDAVEERTRRVEAYVFGAAPDLPAPLDVAEPGPLPAAVAPRARALLARTRELEQVVLASRGRAEREFAYRQH